MTLNDLEHRNSPYFAFFLPNSIALLANFVTVVEVVEDKPMMFVKYCFPVPVFHSITDPAARSLCESWATCLLFCNLCTVIICTVLETSLCKHFLYWLIVWKSDGWQQVYHDWFTGLILRTLGLFNVFTLLNGWICLHGVLD